MLLRTHHSLRTAVSADSVRSASCGWLCVSCVQRRRSCASGRGCCPGSCRGPCVRVTCGFRCGSVLHGAPSHGCSGWPAALCSCSSACWPTPCGTAPSPTATGEAPALHLLCNYIVLEILCNITSVCLFDTAIWKSGIWGCKKIQMLRKSPLKLSKWSLQPCILVLIYLRYDMYKIFSWNMIFT